MAAGSFLEGPGKSPRPRLRLESTAAWIPLPSPKGRAVSKNRHSSLTDEETTEVEVWLVQMDKRVSGFAYQQERDCDVVFRD